MKSPSPYFNAQAKASGVILTFFNYELASLQTVLHLPKIFQPSLEIPLPYFIAQSQGSGVILTFLL